MAQNSAPIGIVAAKRQVAAAGRLILEDPLAFDQAIQPSLRSSQEMLAEPSASMEREKAREIWENLSLEPEVAQERQAERKRLLARAEQLAKDAVQAKEQSAVLEAQLAKARDQRLNDPMVYAGAVGLLALGTLWWLERRKRMLLQERELERWAQAPQPKSNEGDLLAAHAHSEQSYSDAIESVFSLDDAPNVEPKQDGFERELHSGDAPLAAALRGGQDSPNFKDQSALLPETDKKYQPLWQEFPSERNFPAYPQTEQELIDDHWQTKDSGFIALSKRLLKNAIGRNRTQEDSKLGRTQGNSQTHIGSENFSLSTRTHHEYAPVSTQVLHDEETQIQADTKLDEQMFGHAPRVQHSTDQANIDLLSRMRVTARSGEDAVEHLLELRMAVHGLCALGRPEGAAKLLLEHIESSPDTCAWAYLECMHLCEQLDQREPFETLRKRYRQEFNRMAPYWHEPNANVIGLDGYARATGELCNAWSQGRQQAHSLLATWLSGPLIGRKIVQLPAYHDLFDLYELLEFSEQMERGIGAEHAALASTLSEMEHEREFDFVTTVSLLDLDYEFSSDVTLQEGEVAQSEKSVTIALPGHFSVDFNVTGTQMGGLPSGPAELDKK